MPGSHPRGGEGPGLFEVASRLGRLARRPRLDRRGSDHELRRLDLRCAHRRRRQYRHVATQLRQLGMAAMSTIDLQLMWNRLLALVEEQAQVLIRTAFSPIVRECGDISAGIF